MTAAIYARKSTDQTGVADEQKSVARQVEHARAYAVRKGWTVADQYVYVDDGISGAEFANRPGFLRLMNALKPRPPFQVLVMSEEARLGREAIETAYALKQLVTAGVRVFFYLEDRERKLDSPTDKIMLSLTAFADELEREKARQRTRDAMVRKAKAGHVTGGSCFGYRNVEVLAADGQRSHVERVIEPGEAEIIRQIFQLCANGYGIKAIAKTLNAAGAPAPRAQLGRSQSWAPSSVREVLRRPLYRGEIVWGATRKRDAWGQRHQAPRPESDWLRRSAPELHVVSDEEWRAAHARLDRARAVYYGGTKGRSFGRPALGGPSKYLLTGLAQCGCCKSGLVVTSRSHGKGRALFYSCAGYHQRGPSVCRNARSLRMDDANEILIEALLDDALDDTIVADVIDGAIGLIQGNDPAPRLTALEAELEALEREKARLVSAIAAGGQLSELLEGLRTRERRRMALEADRTAVRAQRGLRASETGRVRDELLELAGSWRRVLSEDPDHARPIVSVLLRGRVTYTPLEEEKRWELRGESTLSGLFAVPLYQCPSWDLGNTVFRTHG
jgi:DNA invertase Pin-like site-specific DNA recombinase